MKPFCGLLITLHIAVLRSGGKRVLTFCFGLLAISGLLMHIFGHTSPLLFALVMMPATMSVAAMRPPGANLMLEQQHVRDFASSLINFFGMVMGSVGMF